MFYRLTHIDDVALPTRMTINGDTREVAGGGLLLEPPTLELLPWGSTDGGAILRLDGAEGPDGLPALVIASSEPYRWTNTDRIEISRPNDAPCLRLRGVRQGRRLTLQADPAPEILTGARLQFIEAADEPVQPQWRGTFDFGPPFVVWEDPPPDDEEVLRAIEAQVSSQEPGRIAAAEERLEVAWRAPV